MTFPLLVLLTLACTGDEDVVGPSAQDTDKTLAASEYDIDLDGYTAADDCDDYDAAANPGAEEICDGIDNNCDGETDEATATDASVWYEDADGDGFGSTTSETACDAPSGYVANDEDCNDESADDNPLASEVCDSADNDCDLSIDEGDDEDGDTFDDVCGGDCDDQDATVNSAALEVCDDKDNDCNGQVDGDDADGATSFWLDDDADNYGDPATEVIECPDSAPLGYVEDDTDCDDTNEARNPGATEVCDGAVDEDCDLLIDEGLSTTYYTDTDGDGYGEDATASAVCSDPGTGYSTTGGDCDETNTAVNPGEAEVCNDWLDNDCDGTDNGCAPSGLINLSAADAVILPASEGSNGGSQMGWRVAGGGDIDGDGWDDVVCGARADVSGGGIGAAWVYYDPSGSLLTSDADGQLVSGTGSEDLGNGVTIGDVNDDTYADVIVGAPGTDSVQIWFGPLASTSASPDAVLTGTGGIEFGTSVASGGDVNGDEIDDLVVGALSYSSGSLTGNGAAMVFLGPITGDLTDADADAVLEGEVGGDQAGGEVAIGGDLVGGGAGTVIVGAKGNDTNGTDAGAVYLVDGATTGTLALSLADAIVYGTGGGDDLWDAHDAGDLDGDGSADLVVGASDDATAGSATGAAGVFFGPLSGGATTPYTVSNADFMVTGQATADKFGYAVATAGDFNGDGYDDIIAGAWGDESPAHNSGSAYIVYGPVSAGTIGAAAADVQLGGAEDDQAGLSVAGAFDANGDGYDDVIVGSWQDDAAYTDGGACYVVYGGGI